MRAPRGHLRPLVFVLGLSAGAAFLASRWTDTVAVRGSSMAPALRAGELLLAERWTLRRRRPCPGDIVLARDPRDPDRELIKRVAVVKDGFVTLHGDAAASSDSRVFGSLPQAAVTWRVALRYWPLERFGRVAGQARPATSRC